MQQIQLGATVTDRITGFTGVVTGVVDYITGCKQCLVSPRVKDGGELVSANWFDVDRLLVAAVPVLSLAVSTAGPDAPAPLK